MAKKTAEDSTLKNSTDTAALKEVIAAQEKTIADQAKQIKEQSKDLGDQDKVISGLMEKLSESASRGGDTRPIIKFEGKKYLVIAKSFSHNKSVIAAADLFKETALVRELVESGSGLLQEIK